jgi:hypothetical protein
MFIYSSIGIFKITDCNYINYFISCYWNIFCIIEKHKAESLIFLAFCQCKFTSKELNKETTFHTINPANIFL